MDVLTRHGARRRKLKSSEERRNLPWLTWLLALVWVVALVPSAAAGVQFRSYFFSGEDGLPTNLTKAIYQDEDGYVWVGTDAGLVLYNGLEFQTFTAELPSQYIKEICPINKGQRLVVVSDGGIDYLDRVGLDQIKIDPLTYHGKEPISSTLRYPKTVFEDSRGRLWISEGHAVVRYENGDSKRYEFGPQYVTDSLSRSFLFVEDGNHRIIVSSERGRIFLYNEQEDRFDLLTIRNEENINRIFALELGVGNVLWIGSSEGIYRTPISDNLFGMRWERVGDIELVSSLERDERGNYYVGTWRDGIHYLDLAVDPPSVEKIVAFPYTSVNDICLDRDKQSAWVSTDQGIGVVQPMKFSKFILPEVGFFTTLAKSSDGSVLATDNLSAFRVRIQEGKYTTELLYHNDNVQSHVGSIASNGQDLWVGFHAKVEHFYGAGFGTTSSLNHPFLSLRKPVPLPENWFPINMCLDRSGNLWVTPALISGVARIGLDHEVTYFGKEQGVVAHINVIKQGVDGRLYCGGESRDAFLMRYNERDQRFETLSHRLGFLPGEDDTVQVQDLDMSYDGTLWIATNKGVISYARGEFRRPFGSEFLAETEIKAVAADQGNNVWLGTNHGIYLLKDSQLVSFDTKEGLSDLSVNHRSLYFDHRGHLWAGTAHGLSCMFDPDATIVQTPKPEILTLKYNGQHEIDLKKKNHRIGNLSFIELSYTAMSYPESRVQYQTRLLGMQDAWSEVTDKNHEIFSNLSPGKYTLQVRAQQKGYYWSDMAEYSFEILPAWYQKWWAYVLFTGLSIVFVVLAVKLWLTIRERQLAEEALKENRERYELVAMGSNDGMWDWNLNTNEVYYSPRWKSQIGLQEDVHVHTPEDWLRRVHPDDRDLVEREISLHLKNVTPYLKIEQRVRHTDGSYLWMLTRGIAVCDQKGNPHRIAGSQTDITDRKLSEEQLRHASMHDPLTGLPNRTLFMDRLDRALSRAKRKQKFLFAILFLDLNRFKEVNDTLGHMIGDEMLKAVAERMQAVIRDGDTAARLGGDEFAILLDDLGQKDEALRFVERLIGEMSKPCNLSGHDLEPSASIGIALGSRDYNSAVDLLNHADRAMYRAKRDRSKRFEVFGDLDLEAAGKTK